MLISYNQESGVVNFEATDSIDVRDSLWNLFRAMTVAWAAMEEIEFTEHDPDDAEQDLADAMEKIKELLGVELFGSMEGYIEWLTTNKSSQ